MKPITDLIHKVILTLAVPFSVVVLILLTLSAFAQYYNPLQAELMPLLGLFFPAFLALTFVSLILLVLLKNKLAFLPLFLLIAVAPLVSYYVGRNAATLETGYKILTLNVHGFKGTGETRNQAEIATQIAAMIKDSGADFVCIQEFRSLTGDIRSDVESFVRETGLTHWTYSLYWPKGQRASDIHLIASRYPIGNNGPINAETGRNIGHYADLALEPGAIRLVSVHLVSFSLNQTEISMLGQGEVLSRGTMKKYVPRLSGKLTNTFRIRAIELNDLLRFTNKSPLPLVLAGDFNDTPASFTHRSLRRAGFTDSFPVGGKGFGATYAGRIPLLRIDYVFLSPSFETGESLVLKSKLSDHYPLIVTFDRRKTVQDNQ